MSQFQMHTQGSNNSNSRPFGRGSRSGGGFHRGPHRGGSSHGGPSRGHGHSHSRGHSHGRGRKPAHTGQAIHHSKFINKGIDVVVAPYQPKHAFADFAIDARIKANIAAKKYVTPSAIQDQAIPVVLSGKDIVGIANTGTGKTGAFLIPLLDRVIKAPTQKVIVMVPTRELAIQIEDEFRGFSQGIGFRSVSLVGGASIYNQMKALRHNPNFIFGTPGRIKDLIERKALDLSKFQTVVLDEADRMLDMGFIHDMRRILSNMPSNRNTLFFSATLGPEVEKLVRDFLREPVRISVKTGDTSKSVDQDVVRLQGKDKLVTLLEVLAQPGLDKVIIFGRTKHGVERLSNFLNQKHISSTSIHGNKNQNQRQRSLNDFKENKVRVLVATDVAARGLDIPKVSHVINYDIPATYEDYVHRIGRTGRAGERGKALTFIE